MQEQSDKNELALKEQLLRKRLLKRKQPSIDLATNLQNKASESLSKADKLKEILKTKQKIKKIKKNYEEKLKRDFLFCPISNDESNRIFYRPYCFNKRLDDRLKKCKIILNSEKNEKLKELEEKQLKFT